MKKITITLLLLALMLLAACGGKNKDGVVSIESEIAGIEVGWGPSQKSNQ